MKDDMVQVVADGSIVPVISLRDWFAGQALAGASANSDRIEWTRIGESEPEFLQRLAKDCYDVADAMLKARAK